MVKAGGMRGSWSDPNCSVAVPHFTSSYCIETVILSIPLLGLRHESTANAVYEKKRAAMNVQLRAINVSS